MMLCCRAAGLAAHSDQLAEQGWWAVSAPSGSGAAFVLSRDPVLQAGFGLSLLWGRQ